MWPRPDNLTDAYNWVLVFENGERWTQKQNLSKPKEQRLDVNRPPNKHGRVLAIILEPQKDRLPWIRRRIPKGCRPVYAARTTMAGSVPISLQFLCGYAQDGVRHYTVVDYETGEKCEASDGLG